ncbi:hypothetical protein C8F04DRAFT_1301174 [Mycena alexandri]|uniref:Uncharacterized protein n=1 Tax=Mycena alexandri TaxID=1745969 RepID=A0AAD6SFB9_9AGAR|nr:hypothetical protein C8F04DRAFT_1301174 [Mycena alexandri]
MMRNARTGGTEARCACMCGVPHPHFSFLGVRSYRCGCGRRRARGCAGMGIRRPRASIVFFFFFTSLAGATSNSDCANVIGIGDTPTPRRACTHTPRSSRSGRTHRLLRGGEAMGLKPPQTRVSGGASPKVGALLPAALANTREREWGAGRTPPPLSPRGTTYVQEREREMAVEQKEQRERERSRSEAVCVALGSGGRREREERERELQQQRNGSGNKRVNTRRSGRTVRGNRPSARGDYSSRRATSGR